MSDARPPVVFLLGPSGSGKSTLAAWLAEDADLLHHEIDQFPNGDGIDVAGLRSEWNSFLAGAPARPLIEAIRRQVITAEASGAVLSFPSLLVLSMAQLQELAREGVTAIVLYGPVPECIQAFLHQEAQQPRVQGIDPIDHWIASNRDSYMAFSRPEFAAMRLDAFRDGARIQREALVSEVRRRYAA